MCLLLFIASALAGITHTKLSKQNALGADSLDTGPDTCDAQQITSVATSVYVKVAVSDTAASYLVQLSPPTDGSTNWFTWGVLDTVAGGGIEETDDIGASYREWYIRVILDNLGATEQDYGRAHLTWEY